METLIGNSTCYMLSIFGSSYDSSKTKKTLFIQIFIQTPPFPSIITFNKISHLFIAFFSFSQIITSSKFKTGVVLSALEIHTCRESERMHKISGFPKSAVANQWVGLNIAESAMKCCH